MDWIALILKYWKEALILGLVLTLFATHVRVKELKAKISTLDVTIEKLEFSNDLLVKAVDSHNAATQELNKSTTELKSQIEIAKKTIDGFKPPSVIVKEVYKTDLSAKTCEEKFDWMKDNAIQNKNK